MGGGHPPDEHFLKHILYLIFTARVSPPFYIQFFLGEVRSAFYSDVNLLGDSHVQVMGSHSIETIYSGKPQFSNVMGSHFYSG